MTPNDEKIMDRLNKIEKEIEELKHPPELPCEKGEPECPYATKYALWWVWQQVEELRKKIGEVKNDPHSL